MKIDQQQAIALYNETAVKHKFQPTPLSGSAGSQTLWNIFLLDLLNAAVEKFGDKPAEESETCPKERTQS